MQGHFTGQPLAKRDSKAALQCSFSFSVGLGLQSKVQMHEGPAPCEAIKTALSMALQASNLIRQGLAWPS